MLKINLRDRETNHAVMERTSTALTLENTRAGNVIVIMSMELQQFRKMKNFYCLLIAIIFTSNPILLSAESLWPKILHLKESNKDTISLESKTEFKLINLRQEENPSKLILIFNVTESWESQELTTNNSEISKINLKNIGNQEFALEIQLINNSIPEFTINNKTNKFQISFMKEIEHNQGLSPAPTSTSEHQKAHDIIQVSTTKEPENPTPSDTNIDNSPETLPALTIPKDLPAEKNILSKIEFISSPSSEQYLLLGFSDKPNFSFTLNELNEYEINIPDFRLADIHLAQFFYAPQNILGILSVKSSEGVLNSERFLKIKIKAEEGFRLNILLIDEGIQITASNNY